MNSSNQGYSLVELMVTVLIFSVMSAVVYTAILTGNNSMEVNDTVVELQQDLRQAMVRMKSDLSQAGSVSVIDVPADGSWYTTITFRIPQGVDSDGRINWPVETIQYLLGGPDTKQLQRQIEENLVVTENKVVAENIERLRIRRLTTSPQIVEVSLHAESSGDVGLPSLSSDLDFKVNLRN